MISVLSIGINRVLAAEATVGLLGRDEKAGASVFPVQIPKGAALPALTVNRIFERDVKDDESSMHIAGIVITCLAKSVQEIETIGQALIEEIDGSEFDFADLIAIAFVKAGPDVTGFDAERGLMLRQIEFFVQW